MIFEYYRLSIKLSIGETPKSVVYELSKNLSFEKNYGFIFMKIEYKKFKLYKVGQLIVKEI